MWTENLRSLLRLKKIAYEKLPTGFFLVTGHLAALGCPRLSPTFLSACAITEWFWESCLFRRHYAFYWVTFSSFSKKSVKQYKILRSSWKISNYSRRRKPLYNFVGEYIYSPSFDGSRCTTYNEEITFSIWKMSKNDGARLINFERWYHFCRPFLESPVLAYTPSI